MPDVAVAPGRRAYARVVLKISGESLGNNSDALNPDAFDHVARQIALLTAQRIRCAVVVGGGNIFRGKDAATWGLSGRDGDLTGMLATGINAMLLAGACAKRGVDTAVVTRGPCRGFGSKWTQRDLIEAADAGRVILIAGGSGRPGVSTDVPAVQLAIDIKADAVVMAKHGVGGVYTADPNIDPDARFVHSLTASQALDDDLGVMDRAALELCRTHDLPVHVVDADHPTGVWLAATGWDIGSVIEPH